MTYCEYVMLLESKKVNSMKSPGCLLWLTYVINSKENFLVLFLYLIRSTDWEDKSAVVFNLYFMLGKVHNMLDHIAPERNDSF